MKFLYNCRQALLPQVMNFWKLHLIGHKLQGGGGVNNLNTKIFFIFSQQFDNPHPVDFLITNIHSSEKVSQTWWSNPCRGQECFLQRVWGNLFSDERKDSVNSFEERSFFVIQKVRVSRFGWAKRCEEIKDFPALYCDVGWSSCLWVREKFYPLL